MRIVVNDIAASSGGALTVLKSFHRYVRDHDQGNEWVFLLGSDVLEESPNISMVLLPRVKANWLKRIFFDLISGRRIIASLGPDVVLSLQNTYTYGVGCPQVVYVHQSLPFQKTKNFSLWRRDEWQLAIYQHLVGAIIKQSIRRADHVIVQTKWMRAAILDQIGVAPNRVTAVPPDLDDLSRLQGKGTIDGRAFCYPTAELPYKNNDCVYAACRLLREQGTVDFEVSMTIASPSPDPNVATIGRIPREDVLKVLSSATLIFPSLIETYGLPLAEARALGRTVLAADLPYAREALKGYGRAHFFDPASPKQLAELMARVLRGDLQEMNSEQRDRSPAQAEGIGGWAAVTRIAEALVPEGGRGG